MLYYDTNEVSLYNDYILEQKKTAQKLFDTIFNIKQSTYLQYYVDKSLELQFQHLIENCEDLVNYYSKLSNALDQTTFDAVKMITETNQIMTEHLEMTNRLINQSINRDFDDG